MDGGDREMQRAVQTKDGGESYGSSNIGALEPRSPSSSNDLHLCSNVIGNCCGLIGIWPGLKGITKSIDSDTQRS